jgi:hypothetical protein
VQHRVPGGVVCGSSGNASEAPVEIAGDQPGFQ